MLCDICIKKETCTKICPEVNSYLKKEGVYSYNYIRPHMPSRKRNNKNKYREIPFSTVKNPNLGTISERGVYAGL